MLWREDGHLLRSALDYEGMVKGWKGRQIMFKSMYGGIDDIQVEQRMLFANLSGLLLDTKFRFVVT